MNKELQYNLNHLETNLFQDVVMSAFHNLLTTNELPYNPYPHLVQHFRKYTERFFSIDEDKTFGLFAKNIIPCSVPYLYTLQSHPQLWGLANLVEAIDVTILQRFQWLFDSIMLPVNSLFTYDGYTNQIMVSLGGPLLFQGTFYANEPDFLQIFQEHLIIGPERKMAISIFIQSLLQDIQSINKNSHHFFIELQIQQNGLEEEELSSWNLQEIIDYQDVLVQSLTKAVESFAVIKIKCIFQLSIDLKNYCSGEKFYNLTFMKTFPNSGNQEELEKFNSHPARTLLQSVFFYQNHAEAFFSLYTEYLQGVDDNQQFSAPGYPLFSTPGTHPVYNSKLLSPKNTQVMSLPGFHPQNLGGAPLQSIRMEWQKEISKNEELRIYDSIYLTILLYLQNRHCYPSELLKEVYYLLHCTLGKLNSLMKKTKMLRDLSKRLLSLGDTSCLITQLRLLKHCAQNFLLYSKEEKSGYLICLGRIFDKKISLIITAVQNTPEQVPSLLKELSQYLQAPFLELYEDTVPNCPNFQALILNSKNFFQDSRNFKKGKKKNIQKPFLIPPTLHETDGINLINQEKLVVNIKECLQENKLSDTKTKILIKYLIDSHIDEVWQEYLVFILLEKPVNPYPRLITELRQAAMKMNLFSNSNKDLYQRLSEPNGVELISPENFVYGIPEVSLYGPITALCLVDPSVLCSILDSIPDFWNQPTLQKPGGPYTVSTSFGVGGWAFMYGRIQPYVNEIQTYQHFYIEGPKGCEKVAIEMFTYYVLDDMQRFVNDDQSPVLGIQLSKENPKYFFTKDLQDKVQTFLLQMEQAASEKQTICLQYLVQWNGSYLTVLKFYQLHYITRGQKGNQQFCLSDPLEFYQTIFPTPEKASFHYQNNGPFHGGNPCSISNYKMASGFIGNAINSARNHSCHLDVFKLCLLKILIWQFSPNQIIQGCHVGKIHFVNSVCLCWRMLHSAAAHLDYVVHRLQVLHTLAAILAEQYPDVPLKQWIKWFQPNQRSSLDHFKPAPPFCVKTIFQTINASYNKLRNILMSQIVMIGTTTTSVILKKIESALQQDPNTGLYFPKTDQKASEEIKEIMIMLQSVRDILCEDAENACKRMPIP